MALSPGTRLGHYDVTALIGEGGMGQVWQATDTQLNRQVALKILPDAFASDPERLARFKREAQILASLNHPNIAAIYGIEEAEGTRALVLELVEGPTLADRISKGPIPLDEALPIARQIAEALEAAHEAGVIHRDLKPANIKVREDGTVKVLDFGLAKAFQPDASDPGLSQSPTISLSAAATQMGMVIGTAAYMSPEQAKGKVVDKRADVWAFGAVLYEMLTGRKMFEAGDVSEMLASVLLRDPDISGLGGQVPAHIQSLLRRCLVKDPKDRLRDIGEVRIALHAPEAVPVGEAHVTTAMPLRVWQRPMPLALTGLALVVFASLSVWTLMRPHDAPALVMRSTLTSLADAAPSIAAGLQSDLAISADGTLMVYRGQQPGDTNTRLYLRRLDELDASPLNGSEGGAGPFFSPNGAWVGFWREGTLMKVSTAGGRPTEVARVGSGSRGASWGADDQIIAADTAGNVWRVPAGGGTPEPLLTSDYAEVSRTLYWPSTLADGRAVVFSGSGSGGGEISILSLDTGVVTPLGVIGTGARVVGSGHLVYASEDGSVFAAPFDAAQPAVTGDSVPVGIRVPVKPGGSVALSVSEDGRLLYIPYIPAGGAGGTSDASLVWVGRDGEEEAEPAIENKINGTPRLSPENNRVVVTSGNPPDIWIVDLRRGGDSRLTEGGGVNTYPVWTPDGVTVTFASNRNGSFDIYSRPADRSGPATAVVDVPENVFPGSWAPDGTLLYFVQQQATLRDLWLQPTGGPPAPLLVTPFNERAPRVSPNGQWFAYVSDQSGGSRVYVQPFPAGGERIPISTGPGTEPVWSPDGNELFYRDGPRMMAVSVDSEEAFTAGRPRVLFEGPYLLDRAGSVVPNYDVSLDGQRFLMVKSAAPIGEDAVRTDVIVVSNWFEELKRLVPVD